MFPRFDVSDAVGARDTVNEFFEAMAAEGVERPTNDRIEEIEQTIPGPDGAPDVPIRIYMPKDRTEAGPGFVNFHGGGFILGDLETEHPRCLTMAAEGEAVSVGVDYRLAPENPFPAGVEDCYAALQWVVENAAELKIDSTKIAIGGGSAGGNLTAAVALMARDRGGPDVAFQMLIYPVIDDRCETPSMKNGADLYIWNYQNSLDMWDHYIGKDRSNVSLYAAPARAEDLAGLPPAYTMTCEHDPLRDEAIIYAMRLMAAGVQVELHNYPGTVHGFDFLTPSEISTHAVNEGVEAFKKAMAS
jgi:acetyl esterase/lipase